MVTINRLYQFLLADPSRDSDYKENNEVAGYKVYGTALEMRNRFTAVFRKPSLPFGINLEAASTWHIDDCTIIYYAKKDREISGKPLCFGYLSVTGSHENVDKVGKRLTSSFPRIDDLVKDCNY